MQNHKTNTDRSDEIKAMIKDQLHSRDLFDTSVESALLQMQRHWFVPGHLQSQAYNDSALPIGNDQTISQPYIVALMTSLLQLTGHETVLEIGTGCGYQTAILSLLCKEVHSIEVIADLFHATKKRFEAYNQPSIQKIRLYSGNGRDGLAEQAPFDRILCAAAATEIPPAWVSQLSIGGKMVLPLADAENDSHDLMVVTKKSESELDKKKVIAVRFVPLV